MWLWDNGNAKIYLNEKGATEMIHLREKDTNVPLGSISEEQLQFLIDQLEEEWAEDHDYSITPLLIDL